MIIFSAEIASRTRVFKGDKHQMQMELPISESTQKTMRLKANVEQIRSEILSDLEPSRFPVCWSPAGRAACDELICEVEQRHEGRRQDGTSISRPQAPFGRSRPGQGLIDRCVFYA